MSNPEQHWIAVCASAGCSGDAAAETWSSIAAAYAEPQRHYHTLDHIGALLVLREAHATLFRAADIVDLAILLHDVVYDPKRQDNEAASAVWARDRLMWLGFPSATIETVARFIEMSRHDPVEVAAVDPDSDLALFLDLDLSILAAEPAAYRDYGLAIRHEYAIYPDALYRPGRAKVLRHFVERPAIYISPHFRAAWEALARRSIEAELRELS